MTLTFAMVTQMEYKGKSEFWLHSYQSFKGQSKYILKEENNISFMDSLFMQHWRKE